MATIQIRNVPEAVARKLKIRAAQNGQSLQEYMLSHLIDESEQPTIGELFDEIESRRHRHVSLSAEAIVKTIHDEREAREAQVASAARGVVQRAD